MPSYNFTVGTGYTRNDIYRICDVPIEKQKGNWNTGYTNYGGDWFIFCNVGVAGRTGHDYQNRFIGDDLIWYGKNHSHVGQGSIKTLLDLNSNVYIFYREEERLPFTFAGLAFSIGHIDETPVQITWGFKGEIDTRPEVLPEEVVEPEKYIEGATKTISVNVYERNPQARKECLDKYGYACSVCGFDFESVFGELGKGFIHVHHLKQLADIGEMYELNPIEDLRPVCPNCHSMLHKRRPVYSIEELRKIRDAAYRSNHVDEDNSAGV
jgi:5-methylcytosine-specific restriction protein A